MSCPDWKLLMADRAGGDDPPGWNAALAHMDECDGCRRTALAADPSLVFRRLPAFTADAAEVDAMRRGVANLRHASRVVGEGQDAVPRRRRFFADRLRHLAAALVLAAAGFGLWFAGTGDDAPAAHPAEPIPAVATAAPHGSAGLPVFEDLSRPHQADVYQVGEEGLTVVMMVDETLDI